MGAGFGSVVSKVPIWGKGTRPGKWEHMLNGGTVNGGTTVIDIHEKFQMILTRNEIFLFT